MFRVRSTYLFGSLRLSKLNLYCLLTISTNSTRGGASFPELNLLRVFCGKKFMCYAFLRSLATVFPAAKIVEENLHRYRS